MAGAAGSLIQRASPSQNAASPDEQRGRAERERRAAGAHHRDEAEALARDELAKRHESGRLVTA